MKTIKLYLKNCPVGPGTQIYCMKHENSEDLMNLKEKIFRRCPSLRSATSDPVIYWVDLENDKIRITCDDDLRFFMEESKINKLTFEFERKDPIAMRKRPSSIIDIDNDADEYSKRLRTKMEQIDLTDSSEMEIELSSDDSEDEMEGVKEKEEVDTSTRQENVSSTTTSLDVEEPRINIISVDIIKEADNANPNAANKNTTQTAATAPPPPEQMEKIVEEIHEIEEEQPAAAAAAVDNAQKERKNTASNRIVISDSSEDENEDEGRNFRRFSDGNYSSSYSFANVNGHGDRYNSRASYDDDFRRSYNHHRRRREHFNEHARSTYRSCSENMQRIFSQANSAREQAMRNFRDSATLIPDLLTTFQSHFGPLFNQQQQQSRPRFNQQFSQNYRRY